MSDMTSSSGDLHGSAGLVLRRAREEQGLTIDDLAAIIKVPVAKLTALEADDLTILPNANFNRALAMTVCRALKIDPAPVLALMPAAVAVSLASSKPPLNQPYRDFSHTGLTFEHSSPMSLRVPRLSTAVLAPLVLLLLAGGIYLLPERVDLTAWFHPSVAPSQSAPVASEASGVEMANTVVLPVADVASSAASEGASASAPVLLNPVAVASSATSVASAASSASAPVELPARAVVASPPSAVAVASAVSPVATASSIPIGPIGTLTLSSKEPAWIEVRDAVGQRVFSRQLTAGERVDVQGQPPLKVLAGNAPSVTIQFNGRPVDLAAVTRQNVARIELK